jgi:hypothetical protein
VTISNRSSAQKNSSKLRRVWVSGKWEAAEGKEGDRRKACALEHLKVSGARAGSSVRALLAEAVGGGEPKDAMISR